MTPEQLRKESEIILEISGHLHSAQGYRLEIAALEERISDINVRIKTYVDAKKNNDRQIANARERLQILYNEIELTEMEGIPSGEEKPERLDREVF